MAVQLDAILSRCGVRSATMRGSMRGGEERVMIAVTRLDGTVFYVNADLIELMEVSPDTVLKLTTQHRYVVRESADEVIERIVRFRRRVQQAWPEVESSALPA